MTLALSARAYSLWGPVANGGDSWQTPTLGYGTLPGCEVGGFVGAPKNLGEEFRWNVPTFYYAFDQNFLDYFGSNGVVTLEQMFVTLSNHLSAAPLSSWSADLSEFPLYTTRINLTAQALQIYDFKTVTLSDMMQELGLADPTVWVWTLRDRVLPAGAKCPDYTYSVIQRNFDPLTPQPSKYINGTLFTYTIVQGDCATCNNTLMLNTPVDPLAVWPSAVASDTAFTYGGFYTGLTRDDMGGLRYLMATNNMNVEAADANSVLQSGGFTNRNVQQLLTSQDLNALVRAAYTNDAAGLQALYPGLRVADTYSFFAYEVTTNYIGSFTSSPFGVAGTFVFNVTQTYTTNVVQRYRHTFLNVFTNTFRLGAYVTTLSASASFYAWATPSGTTFTNVQFTGGSATTAFDTNQISGDFFLIPTNQCGLAILYPILTNVVATTNQAAAITNTLVVGVTNNTGQFSQSTVTYFTNHTVVINPVDCQATGYADGVSLRQGIDRMFFFRHDYDSLLGQYFSPVTNSYQLTSVQGNQLAVQTYRRILGQPDILFTASDLGYNVTSKHTDGNYDTANVLPNLAGPGRRIGPIVFTYNKVGPVLINQGAAFLTELDAVQSFVWGTYDLSTNAPVIFPNGSDITALENQVLMQIVSTNLPATALPDATNGVAYAPVTLTGSGGTQPYVWSLASFTLSGWPNGISLVSANSSGVISSGTNLVTGNVPGIYDVTVQMTDAGGRSVVRDFTLTVH